MTSFNNSSVVYALKKVPQAYPTTYDANEAFYNDVIMGLSKNPKELPCKYFYDERGSIIFTQICNTADYYVTRTECQLMENIVPELAAMVGSGATIIEFGSGEGKKIRQLLGSLTKPFAYVPIEISSEILNHSAAKLKMEFNEVAIYPVVADYMGDITLPRQIAAMNNRKVVYFPGSTISNFTPEEATHFFKKISALLKPGDGFIIGVDLIKSPNKLHRAYNDSEGVTKAFNLNILQRVNNELGGNFNLDLFEHYAYFDPVKRRIEMHLISLCDQWVKIGTMKVHFKHGESIHTENSYKFTLSDVSKMGFNAGFRNVKMWTDPENLFSVSYLQKV